jgi:uncharacterized protein (TIGR02145 family)
MKHIFTISLCFLALSLSVYGQVPDYIPSDGLVAWYPFNGNALDESFNGHDANVVGATLSEDRFGSFESAYLFDGDDRIFPSNYEDFPLQERTTSIWVKSNVLATGGRGVFGYGGANCGDSWMLTYNNQGNLPSSAFAYEFQGHCNNQAVSSPMAPEDFISWHHIVGRTSQSGTDIFIDGILETHSDLFVSNTVPNCAVLGAQPSPSGLCEYQDSNNQLWDGLLDDFGVWNRALTDIEILGIFQAAPPVLGCTNQEACNFDVEAVIDDGTCHYEDGCGVCGGVSFAGCTDSYACNYDFEAGCDDGSCDYSCCPGPGCCLDGQNWDWDLMGCVITNPTDSNLDGCTDLNDLMDLLAAYGICVDPEYTCGDLVSHDGYDYSTVQIGDQCWFSENCRYLPAVSPSSAQSTTDPYYYVYDYQGTDVTSAQATSSFATYGVLYNWPAVMTEGLCPSGWHIPSDGEWQTLEISLGMSESDAAIDGWRGSPVGDYMKSTTGWSNNGNGLNTIGFIALPGGSNYSGVFSSTGLYGHWWSASESGSSARRRVLNYYEKVYRDAYNRDDGFSARCVQD